MIPYDDDDDENDDDEGAMHRRPFSHSLDEEIEGFLAAKWESMVPGDEPKALGAASDSALVNAVKDAAQEMFAAHGDDADDGVGVDGESDDDEDSLMK